MRTSSGCGALWPLALVALADLGRGAVRAVAVAESV